MSTNDSATPEKSIHTQFVTFAFLTMATSNQNLDDATTQVTQLIDKIEGEYDDIGLIIDPAFVNKTVTIHWDQTTSHLELALDCLLSAMVESGSDDRNAWRGEAQSAIDALEEALAIEAMTTLKREQMILSRDT